MKFERAAWARVKRIAWSSARFSIYQNERMKFGRRSVGLTRTVKCMQQSVDVVSIIPHFWIDTFDAKSRTHFLCVFSNFQVFPIHIYSLESLLHSTFLLLHVHHDKKLWIFQHICNYTSSAIGFGLHIVLFFNALWGRKKVVLRGIWTFNFIIYNLLLCVQELDGEQSM